MVKIFEQEQKNFDDMDRALPGLFEWVWELYRHGDQIIHRMTTSHAGTPIARQVLTAMAADGLNSLRGIIVLCELGLQREAEKLCRPLFETFLAAKFIAEPPPHGKFGLPPVPTEIDAHEFFGQLYIVAPILKHERRLKSIPASAVVDQRAHDESLNTFQKLGDELRAELGTAWAERVSRGSTFAGIDVGSVAAHFNCENDYNSVYGPQSSFVHGSQAVGGAVVVPNGILLNKFSPPDAIERILKLSAMYFDRLLDVCAAYAGVATDPVDTGEKTASTDPAT